MDRRHILMGLASMPFASVVLAQVPTALKLSTGASGGTFFDYGAGIGRLLESKTSLKIEVMPSAGSIENLRRIESGQADLALLAMGPGYEAWTASAAPWLGNPPLKSARALVPMYETPFHLATIEASGVKTVRELDGKKVGVGPKGGANEQIFMKLAEGLSIKPELVFGDPGALADQVIKKEITAIFFGAGAPIPAYAKIAGAEQIRFLPLDGDSGAALRKAFPYLAANTIPANTYRGQSQAVPTVALWNFIVARQGLADEAAYQITKAILSDPTAAKALHPAAAATVIGNIGANSFMPFHPGAVRYLRETGAAIENLPK
ncbi:MAG: TAXI family TRAP transporter solute-binding subunit [Rhabdaerophilum sp.]